MNEQLLIANAVCFFILVALGIAIGHWKAKRARSYRWSRGKKVYHD